MGLRTELRLLGLAAGTLTHRAILPGLEIKFLKVDHIKLFKEEIPSIQVNHELTHFTL